eukprot:gene31926-39445_t
MSPLDPEAAQDYAGGRVKQDTTFIKGVKVELGAESLHGRYTELTKFAEENNEELWEVYPVSHGDGGPAEKPVSNGYEVDGEGDKDYSFKNSYSCLIDHLKKDLQIEINTPVQHIQWPDASNSADGIITLTTKSGVEYKTRNVVVTASPHVINNELITFTPPLSDEIRGAFDGTKMNSVTKVIMKFSKPCWPKNLHGMIMTDDSFLLPEIWFREVADEVDANEPATAYAVGFTTAKYADRLKSMSQEEVLRQSVAQLEKVFGMLEQRHMSAEVGDKSAQTPSSLPLASSVFLDGMLYTWGADSHPYIGGGYGAPKINRPTNAGDILSRPNGEHMFFAGEATNFLPGATAHSALETGLRAAEQVGDALKKDGWI